MITTAADQYTVVDGRRIRYVEAGSGAPLLLLHGLGLDASADQWVLSFELLSRRYRTIAMDMFGWGRSDRPPEGYSFPAFVSTVVGLLKNLGISRASLAGHTLGGWTCALVAHQHPELVEKLVLTNTAGLNPTAPRSPDTFKLPDRQGIRESLERTFGGALQVTEAMVDEQLARQSRPGVAESYFTILRYINDPAVRAEWSLVQRLPQVTTPTLVVWGADDEIIRPQFGEQAAGLLPNGKLVLIEGGKHAPQCHKPQEYARVVSEFLG